MAFVESRPESGPKAEKEEDGRSNGTQAVQNNKSTDQPWDSRQRGGGGG